MQSILVLRLKSEVLRPPIQLTFHIKPPILGPFGALQWRLNMIEWSVLSWSNQGTTCKVNWWHKQRLSVIFVSWCTWRPSEVNLKYTSGQEARPCDLFKVLLFGFSKILSCTEVVFVVRFILCLMYVFRIPMPCAGNRQESFIPIVDFLRLDSFWCTSSEDNTCPQSLNITPLQERFVGKYMGWYFLGQDYIQEHVYLILFPHQNIKYTHEIEIDVDLCTNLYPSIDRDVKAFRGCNRFLAFLSFLTKANAPLSYAAPMDIEGFACDAFQMKEAALKCKEGRGSAGGWLLFDPYVLGKGAGPKPEPVPLLEHAWVEKDHFLRWTSTFSNVWQ